MTKDERQTVLLRETISAEIAAIAELETQPHARAFVDPMSLVEHEALSAREDVQYLTIATSELPLAGYFILIHEVENNAVEFRRVVVAARARGIGQQAIRSMERYSLQRFAPSRMWLDVYDENERGKHIYAKLGYVRFDTQPRLGRELHFYEKWFASATNVDTTAAF